MFIAKLKKLDDRVKSLEQKLQVSEEEIQALKAKQKALETKIIYLTNHSSQVATNENETEVSTSSNLEAMIKSDIITKLKRLPLENEEKPRKFLIADLKLLIGNYIRPVNMALYMIQIVKDLDMALEAKDETTFQLYADRLSNILASNDIEFDASKL